MRVEAKFTLCITAVLTIFIGAAIALEPSVRDSTIMSLGAQCVVAAAVVAYLAARRLVSVPAEILGRKMLEIADAKTFDQTVPVEAARQDLSLTARAFNRLVASSGSSVNALQQEKSELQTQLTALRAELTAARGDMAILQGERTGSTSSAVATERANFVVSSSPAPIFTMDTEGTVRSWNAAAERIFGWNASECIGRPPVIVPDENGNEDIVGQLLEGKSFTGVQGVAEAKDGSAVNVSMDVAPARDSSGKINELIVVVSGRVVGAAIAETIVEQRQTGEATQASAEASTPSQEAIAETRSAVAEENVQAANIGAEVVADAVVEVVAAAEAATAETAGSEVPTLRLVRDDEESVAAEAPAFPRAAGQWPSEGGVYFDPEASNEQELEIFAAEGTVADKGETSKAKRGAAARGVRKTGKKTAIKQSKPKARAAVTKRQRQVA